MPISRYRCKKCGKEFQVFQKITDSPLKSCSFCAGKVDLVPVPLFHNTPSFSLAFVDKEKKEEEKPKNIIRARARPKPEQKSPAKKLTPPAKNKKVEKKKPSKKLPKNNKSKKMKK